MGKQKAQQHSNHQKALLDSGQDFWVSIPTLLPLSQESLGSSSEPQFPHLNLVFLYFFIIESSPQTYWKKEEFPPQKKSTNKFQIEAQPEETKRIKGEKNGKFLLWLSGFWTRLASMRMRVQSLASLSGLRIWHCHELWYRSQMWLGSGVLWLLCRLAAAALIQALAWEHPYATGVALKSKKKNKTKRK